MTIISAVLGEKWIAVASDSFRTGWNEADQRFDVLEDKLTKVVLVPKIGALAWCGYCGWDNDDILTWFEERAANAKGSPEEFATLMTKELNDHFGDFPVGIAVHFVAYEVHDGVSVPELFYIHNWNGNYEVPKKQKVICQRHSFFTVSSNEGQPLPEHRKKTLSAQGAGSNSNTEPLNLQ